jgi:MEMO1 family protein
LKRQALQRRLTAAVALLALCGMARLYAQESAVRDVRDSVGFCWEANAMARFIKRLDSIQPPGAVRPIVAAISPHDDYLYAGRLYHQLFSALRTKEAVIFGVTHGTVRKQIGDPTGILIMDSWRQWTAPGMWLSLSPLWSAIRGRLDKKLFLVNTQAQDLEHSIEALVPFLTHYNPDLRITPVMVTAMPFDRMQAVADTLSGIIANYIRDKGLVLGRDIVILISSDANHYGRDFNNTPFGETAEAHRRGTAQDREIAGLLTGGELTDEKIQAFNTRMEKVMWCGKFSVPLGLLTAARVARKVTGHGLRGNLLRYSDTYTEGTLLPGNSGMGTTAPASLQHWVGFAAIEFLEVK